MAKGDYKPLGCSVASCEGRHKAKGFCIKHYRQHQRGGIKADPTTCAHCGTTFQPFNVQAMYCSRGCKIDAWKVRHLGIGRQRRREEITPKQPGLTAIERLVKKEAASLHRIARYVERPLLFRHPCGQCDAVMVVRRNGGLHQQICEECRLKNARRANKVSKLKRIAMKRGVDADSIDPIKVFERDKWRCHICNIKTPRKLRGTYDDRAPELEHIVPLSQGGTHTWGNVACSCRKCNGAKGATAFGQLGLRIAA